MIHQRQYDFQVIEIRIFEATGPDSFVFPIELNIPGRRSYPTLQLRLDPDTLLSAATSPEIYGTRLGQALFAETSIGPAYREALAMLQAQGIKSRLKLRVDALDLQDIYWERLFHPVGDQWTPLALDATTPFSRFQLEQSWRPVEPIILRPVRMLVVLASPSNLDEYGLDSINKHEREALRETLDSLPDTSITYLESDTNQLPSLANLRAELTSGYHIIYFMCHGAETRRGTILYLEDEDGQVEIVRDRRLASSFAALERPPHFCFFAACESASRSKQDVFVPLAPMLIAQGNIPAVVAMTEKVGLKTAQRFTGHFFVRLFEHGFIDLAMNEARALIQDAWDWSVPALLSHLPDNQLLGFDKRIDASPSSSEAALLSHFHISPPPHPLEPPHVTDLFGREADLAYFSEKLHSSNLAVITGMPGLGKTALAAVLARKTVDVDHIFWYPFHQNESISAIIWKMAGFLAWNGQKQLWEMLEETRQAGSELPPTKVLFDYLLKLIKGQGYLLCFDDFHFVEDDPLLDQLVDHMQTLVFAGEIKLIIISRQMPNFVQTVQFNPLSGLSDTATSDLITHYGLDLPQDIAYLLFNHTEGNPHLLTLALNTLKRSKNPAKLVANLIDSEDIERYLLHEIDRVLTDKERDVLQAVSVFLGFPSTRDAIEILLDAGRLRSILRTLVDRFLLSVSEGEWDKEYNQHAIIQAFYYDGLSSRERRQFHRYAAEYYEKEAYPDPFRAALHYQRAGDYGRAADLMTRDIWSVISKGQAKVAAALLNAFTPQQLEPVQWAEVRLGLGELYRYFKERNEAEAYYEEALSALDRLPEDQVRQLKAITCRGMSDLARAESAPTALDWLEKGLAILTDADQWLKADLLLKVSSIQIYSSQYQAAHDTIQTALALLPAASHQSRIGALMNLGLIHWRQGNLDQAIQATQEAVAIAKNLHNGFLLINLWNNLGIYYDVSGAWAQSVKAYEQALTFADQLGDVQHQVMAKFNLGFLHINQGAYELALARLTDSLALAQAHTLEAHQVYIQQSLATLYIRQKEIPLAETALTLAEKLIEQTQITEEIPGIYRAWAELFFLQNNLTEALLYAEKSIAAAREFENPTEVGSSLRVLAQILAHQDSDDVEQTFLQSLSLLENSEPYEAARTQLAWGQYAALHGDRDHSLQLLETAQTTFEQLGARADLAAVKTWLPI